MRIAVTAILAAAIATAGLAAPTTAEARCEHCGPASRTVVKTNYRYNDVQQVRHVISYRDVTQVHNVTQYRDVVRPNYVNVVHRTVDVTRVRPVTRINTVTRVHNVTVYQHQRQGSSHVVGMPGRTVWSHGSVMARGHDVRGGHHMVYLNGGVRNVHCNF